MFLGQIGPPCVRCGREANHAGPCVRPPEFDVYVDTSPSVWWDVAACVAFVMFYLAFVWMVI